MIFDGQPTTALADRCRQLVSAKYRIDDWLDARRRLYLGCSWHQGPDSDIDDWLQAIAQNQAVDDKLWLAARHPNIRKTKVSTRRRPGVPEKRPRELPPYALRPDEFIKHVLPGAHALPGVREIIYGASARVLRDVDSSLVIGGTYRRYNPEAASLEDLDRINAGNQAEYVKVGSLPLYIATEGKNRVRAFQLKGKPISAVTRSCDFPSADALELHEVEGSGIFAISGTTSDAIRGIGSDKPRILILPSVTVPLLKSYGVCWGRRLSRGVTGRRAREFERAQREARSKLALCESLGL